MGLGGGYKKSVVLIYSLEVQRLFLEWFLRKDRIVLVRVSNPQFQGTILLIVNLYPLHTCIQTISSYVRCRLQVPFLLGVDTTEYS